MKVCFETFGCRLNRAEALQMEADYIARGWMVTDKHSEADLIVVRGCSVTHRAEHDTRVLIEHLRKHYPNTTLRIEGCYQKPPKQQADPPSDLLTISQRTARAYLKVQDGCSGKCTFCIVPQFRGESVSVPFQDVLTKAKRFVEAGYHEIVLTGCNLALYASEGKRFPELLEALADLSPDCRLRIGSLEPGEIALKAVDVIAEKKNICRFLHLPIQSGSQTILARMRRNYTVTDVEKIVLKATVAMPLVGLGCDVMTGFPGETQKDHEMTIGLLKRLPFSNFHVFPYSSRPKTLAAGYPGANTKEVRHGRAHEISKFGDAQRRAFAKRFVGRDVEIILEDEKKGTGWTGEYFACEIKNLGKAVNYHRKDIVRLHVLEAHNAHLTGVLLGK